MMLDVTPLVINLRVESTTKVRKGSVACDFVNAWTKSKGLRSLLG